MKVKMCTKNHEKEKVVHQRVFNKEKSIFKPWIEDTEKTYDECTALDFKFWKVPRMLKNDPLDLEECQKLVLKHFEKLKHIYTILISDDEYPNIGWNKFT